MKRFIQGECRGQSTLLPESLDDYVAETNPVRVVDVFVDELDLGRLGFDGVVPAETGRPAYHPAVLLKIYIYGYLNRIQSSRRLEREAQRNVELMWLTGRLMPDFKTIANFRKDNGTAIRRVCRQFVVLCQQLGLFAEALVAIDGSKFKAVNNRDRNFTSAKLQRRMEEIESSISRYLTALDTADRQEPAVAKAKTSAAAAAGRFGRDDFIYDAAHNEYRCPAGERLIWRFATVEKGLKLHRYWSSHCQGCALKDQCTPSAQRRVSRWEHESVLDAMQYRLDQAPEMMRIRRQTVEHPFGTLKAWMGATHFFTKTLDRVSTEMSLHALAYNFKRVLNLLGSNALMAAMKV